MLPGQPNLRIAMTALGEKPLTLPPNSCDVAVQQVLGDHHHVVAALAQRRQVDVDHVEPVVEILAEAAVP